MAKTYRVIVLITADTAKDAELLREEIIGAIEDNAESKEIPASATVDALDLIHSDGR